MLKWFRNHPIISSTSGALGIASLGTLALWLKPELANHLPSPLQRLLAHIWPEPAPELDFEGSKIPQEIQTSSQELVDAIHALSETFRKEMPEGWPDGFLVQLAQLTLGYLGNWREADMMLNNYSVALNVAFSQLQATQASQPAVISRSVN